MRRPRFVRALGLLGVLALAGPVVGCGRGGTPGPTTEELATQKAIRSVIRDAQKKQLGGASGATRGGASRTGQPGAKSGQ